MANPRRSSYSTSLTNQSLDSTTSTLTSNPIQSQTLTATLSSLKFYLKKPHSFPILLSLLLLLTWISLRLQNSSAAHFSSPPHLRHRTSNTAVDGGDDLKHSLVKFSTVFPSPIAKDKRGWLLNPVSVALDAGLSGGATDCASVHIGEIRPGSIRGNHRHYTCNETFLIWGAKTMFRLENTAVSKGYAEVIIEADEVAVATSPNGTAHVLINIDPVRGTFFVGCQDSVISYSNSTSDFNVWRDL